uniref:Uncharacterized protein n=1 Tax=Parascaris univalens TaxID=6257 RepID=A0A915C958_PARUN
MWSIVFVSLVYLIYSLRIAISDKQYAIEYYDSNMKLDRKLLNKTQCEIYTKECIEYRMCYPKCSLQKKNIRNERYNPCRIFVEPCFAIPLSEYYRIKHFTDDDDF